MKLDSLLILISGNDSKETNNSSFIFSVLSLFFLVFLVEKVNFEYETNKIRKAKAIQIILLYKSNPVNVGLRVFFSTGV